MAAVAGSDAEGQQLPIVLVTGATGFIATWIVRMLLETKAYSVRGTVRSLESAKAAYLRRLPGSSEHLQLVQADLSSDAGWEEAVRGSTYVLHVASPAPIKMATDEQELIRPAVDGTRRVVSAALAAPTVERIVVTSSTAAVMHGHAKEPEVFDETIWAEPDNCSPYPKSKTLAEREVWRLVSEAEAEAQPGRVVPQVCTMNPALVLGPVLGVTTSASSQIISKFLNGSIPAIPDVTFCTVDVRDVARCHIAALVTTNPVHRRRFLLGPTPLHFDQFAAILGDEFGALGYSVPTWRLPYWVLSIMSLWDREVAQVVSRVGKRPAFDCGPAKELLLGPGRDWMDTEAAMRAMGYDCVRLGAAPDKSGGEEARFQTQAELEVDVRGLAPPAQGAAMAAAAAAAAAAGGAAEA